MSTNNICFRGEIRKILFGYPLLSVAMLFKVHQMGPNKKICVFRVTQPYLMFLVKPSNFFPVLLE